MYAIITNHCRDCLELDCTRGAGGPQGLISNHLKSVDNVINDEDDGNIPVLKRMSDIRFRSTRQLIINATPPQ